jgi:transposase
LLTDRDDDAGWFRRALAERGITACIPSKKSRKVPIPHDFALYRQRHKVENMSAIGIAATVIFWLPQ